MKFSFSLARNYRGKPSEPATPKPLAGADVIGELSYFGPDELERLRVGQRVRVGRYGRFVVGEIVRLGPIPPLRDGRRVVRDLHNLTTPDVGQRKVVVRLQLVTIRDRQVEVKARELIRVEPRR